MATAHLKELMPDFDKDKEWIELHRKLKDQKRITFIPIWSYAAAILILLSIGLYLVKQSARDPNSVEKKIASAPIPVEKKAIVLPSKPLLIDSIKKAIPVLQKNSLVLFKIKKASTANETATFLAQNVEPITTQPAILEKKIDSPASPKNVAAVKKPRPQAIHILDMENEDRAFMINKDYSGNPTGIVGRLQNLFVKPGSIVSSDNPYPMQIILKK